HLRPGMVLARDIPGYDGSVFLPADRGLNANDISTLREMDIGHVHIKSRGEEKDRKDLLRRCEDYVFEFFVYVNPESRLFNEIYRLTLEKTFCSASLDWDLPCSKELRAKSVEHMRDLFFRGQGRPRDIVDHETSLVSFPDIYFRIKDILEDDSSSAEDIAEVVSNDIGLSAKLLQLVNSPFYGFSVKIDSITRAISLIGVRELTTLALSISAINFFRDIPPELIDMRSFWKHSLSCAIYSKLIASETGLPPEKFFSAGLLHDAGRLIIFKNMPYAATQALLEARTNMIPLVEAEETILGFDHTEVGRDLFAAWQMPEQLTDSVGHHHRPDKAAVPRDAAVIQLADNLANASAVAEGGKFVLPGMEEKNWENINLPLDRLAELVRIHDQNIESVLIAFM
ncbi:MAG: HDOD domain-containing protein, partial [Desulfonatronovibrionaceae bacterium]